MPRNPVGWFEIYVQDMERAKAFYESVLGVDLEEMKDPGPGISAMWSFPTQKDAAGAAGALARMDNGPSGGNATIVYFTCADCAVEAGRVSESGGKVMKDKFSIGRYGFIALVTDTEGNTIGLHSIK
jgi:predicted enzyme related to lactoylglutathione lyase